MQQQTDDRSDATSIYIKTICYVLLSAVLVLFLRFARIVTLPLASAVLFLMLLYSLYAWCKKYIPAWMSRAVVPATIMIAAAAIAAIVYLVTLSLGEVQQKYPEYTRKAEVLWQQLELSAARYNISLEATGRAEGFLRDVLGFFTVSLVSVALFVAAVVVVLFLMLLMVLEIREWRERVAVCYSGQRLRTVSDTVSTIRKKVTRFFFVRSVVSVVTGVLGGLLLWILQVDFFLTWGLLIFILNYIPYFGSVVAVIPPVTIALLQYDSMHALIVLAGLAVINQVLGNFVDPRLEGRVLRLSPVIVLLSILFWEWVWGVPGAFLGIPMYIALVSIGEQLPDLRRVARLFSRSAENGG